MKKLIFFILLFVIGLAGCQTSSTSNSTVEITTGQDLLEKAKESTRNALLLEFNKFDKNNYSLENYQIIIDLKEAGILDINAITEIELINSFDINSIIMNMKKVSLTTGDLPWI